jgi:hypothetical protein
VSWSILTLEVEVYSAFRLEQHLVQLHMPLQYGHFHFFNRGLKSMSLGYLDRSVNATKGVGRWCRPFGDTRSTEQFSTGSGSGNVVRCAAHKRIPWPAATLVTPVFAHVRIRLEFLFPCRGGGSIPETISTFSFLGRLWRLIDRGRWTGNIHCFKAGN